MPFHLGYKSYNSIMHLPDSKHGTDDTCNPGQVKICTQQVKEKNDLIWVQEKLDGSNVAVLKKDGRIWAINRAGWHCNDSAPHLVHRLFNTWVNRNYERFDSFLEEGERLCGEYMEIAHGTMYDMPHEPFVVFDLCQGKEKLPYLTTRERIQDKFVMAALLNDGKPMSVEVALSKLNSSTHGAQEEIEGCVWRAERNGKLQFQTKYVRHSKIAGKYFWDKDGKDIVVYNKFKERG